MRDTFHMSQSMRSLDMDWMAMCEKKSGEHGMMRKSNDRMMGLFVAETLGLRSTRMKSNPWASDSSSKRPRKQPGMLSAVGKASGLLAASEILGS
jgi:hypothetical protein